MATKSVKTLKANNVQILNAIRDQASATYQERIPKADQGDITATMRALDKFPLMWNEFVDGLINRIGLVVMQSNTWSNPLKDLKKGLVEYGDTVEEYRANLIQAQRWDADTCHQDVFACNPPEIEASFHTINRQDVYRLSVNEMLIRRAFTNENGLQGAIGEIMQLPYASDETDEYLIMKNLFKEYEQAYGYTKVNVPAVENKLDRASIEAQALYIAQVIDEYKYLFDFMKTDFNGLGWPTSTRGFKIIVFAEPHLASVLDTYVIPYAFRDTNSINLTVIPIDDFGIEGCQAIMCDERHIQCYDTYMAFKSIENPLGRSWNYFWHHDGIYSMSKFVNAVMFTTNEATPVPVNPTYTIETVTPAIAPLANGTTPEFAEPGGKLRMMATVTGTVTPAEAGEVPQGVTWTVTGETQLAQKTYITADGWLHIDERETNTKLTVQAESVIYPAQGGSPAAGTVEVGVGAAVAG